MAEDVTLAPLATLQNSSIISTINANNTLIENAFVDCLSLTGNQPNAMQSDLDMNGKQIINLPAPATLNSPIRLVDYTTANLITSASGSIIFDTLAQFKALTVIPSFAQYITVNAVTGTYPAATGLESTPLTYRRVSTTTGLYGEITVAGQLFAPIYSTNPVNIGEFGIIADASYIEAATYITATADGTSTLTTASTTGLVVGMNITNLSWHSFGVNAIPVNTTVVSFIPNTSITVSNNVIAGSNLSLIAWSETLTGTDNYQAFQAALDFAMQNRCSDVRVPLGKYLISDTLNMGWGDSFYEVHLIGVNRAAFAGSLPGPSLYFTKVDRPAISVQGARSSSIQGIALIGRNRVFAQYAQWFSNNLSSDALDWLDPRFIPNGNNPGGLQTHSPYAGITQDAYSGTQPIDHYPDKSFPTWTGLSTQYNKVLSSDVLIQDCDIEGFAVQITSGLNTNNQGDFLKMYRLILSAGAYGVSINNTQSRNVEFRNASYSAFHTLFSGTNLGLGTGEIVGPIDNISGGGSYQFFDFSNMGFSGPLLINNLYCENQIRIGNFVGNSAFSCNVILRGGNINLGNTQSLIPDSYITSGSFGYIILENVDINGGLRIGNLIKGGGRLEVRGGTWEAATASPANSSLQNAINYCGSILVGDCRFNASNVRALDISDLKCTYYSAPSGSIGSNQHHHTIRFENSNGTLTRAPMTQCATKYIDQNKRQWSMTVTPENTFNSTFTSAGFNISNDSLTFGYLQAFQEHADSMYHMAAGDIIFHLASWTIFVITNVGALSGGNYPITAQQQNNLQLNGDNTFKVQLNTNTTLTGNSVLIKTGARIPSTLNYATFTSGSGNLTNISTNGTSSSMANQVINGDSFFGLTQGSINVPYRQWPVAPISTISAVTDGSPGTATLSKNALVSGVFPLFPYELY